MLLFYEPKKKLSNPFYIISSNTPIIEKGEEDLVPKFKYSIQDHTFLWRWLTIGL